MENILTLGQKALEVLKVFGYIDLSGTGIRALSHALIELFKGHCLAQIVRVFNIVHEIVEAEIFNIAAVKMLLGKVSGGTAAQYEITHRSVTP